MELLQYILLSNLLVAVFGTPTVNGYVYSFGSLPRNPRTPKTCRRGCSSNGDFQTFTSSPRGTNGRSRQKEINQAFRELREELEGMNVDISSGYYDPFGRLVSEMVDRDTAKKWIDKTFDIASEFNKDFATIPQEQETNDKNLRKTRDLFVSVFDSLYDNDQDHTEVVGDDTKPSPDPVENDSSVNTDIDKDLKQAMKKVTETPNWENRSNDKTFSVAIDLPGVNRADIEISIEGDDVLILRAKRDTGSEENSRIVRIYTAEIALPEANQIDVEKLEATMKNGVLVITAPMHKPSEKRRTIQIS